MNLLLAAFCGSAAFANAWRHGNGLKVSTTSGHVHGKIDPELPNVRQFLGIPYAQPPIGDLRWKAPQALSQPEKQINATEVGPSCYQFVSTDDASIYTSDVLQFNLQGKNGTGSVSEDCLTVSVWTPTTEYCNRRNEESEGLPVIIFFYGGGFSTGGVDVPYQIPTQWVDRTPNHIVVSFNYRVDIFGFPGTPGLKDQNLGLLDQRAAVEWVKENIAAFGGDVDKMIIWGQSAGAASVDYYNFAYPDDPIVNGLAMDSGTALLGIWGDSTGANFSYVADNVGCSGLSNDTAAEIACMRKIDAQVIEDFVANYSLSENLLFASSPDEKIVFSNYTERALEGKQAQIPAIIGTNLNDGVAFLPYEINGPDEDLAEEALLSEFFCPGTESISLRQQTGLTTYVYRYSGNFSNISPRFWMGAYHSAELPLLFGTHPNYRGNSTELEYATSHAMQDAWVAFAKDPVDGLKGQDWQVYETLGAESVREFGAGVAAKDISLASVEALCDGGLLIETL